MNSLTNFWTNTSLSFFWILLDYSWSFSSNLASCKVLFLPNLKDFFTTTSSSWSSSSKLNTPFFFESVAFEDKCENFDFGYKFCWVIMTCCSSDSHFYFSNSCFDIVPDFFTWDSSKKSTVDVANDCWREAFLCWYFF